MSADVLRVAIFTGNSNSGSACIEALLSGRYAGKLRVRGVFRSEAKAALVVAKYPADALEVVVGADANKPETMIAAFKDSDYALIVTPHDPSNHDSFADDARLTINMIDAAVKEGVKYVVLVASWTVIDVDRMPIIAGRFAPVEAHLTRLGEQNGLKWTVLRGGCVNICSNYFCVLS